MPSRRKQSGSLFFDCTRSSEYSICLVCNPGKKKHCIVAVIFPRAFPAQEFGGVLKINCSVERFLFQRQ